MIQRWKIKSNVKSSKGDKYLFISTKYKHVKTWHNTKNDLKMLCGRNWMLLNLGRLVTSTCWSDDKNVTVTYMYQVNSNIKNKK